MAISIGVNTVPRGQRASHILGYTEHIIANWSKEVIASLFNTGVVSLSILHAVWGPRCKDIKILNCPV